MDFQYKFWKRNPKAQGDIMDGMMNQAWTGFQKALDDGVNLPVISNFIG